MACGVPTFVCLWKKTRNTRRSKYLQLNQKMPHCKFIVYKENASYEGPNGLGQRTVFAR